MQLSKISKIFLVAITAFIAFVMVSCMNKPEPPHYVGIQLWSVRNDMGKDASGTLQQLGEMGYSFIEAASYSNGKFYGMEPEEFRGLVESAGMEFLSSHCGIGLPAAGEYNSAIEWWKIAIDAHLRAGASYIVLPSMPRSAFRDFEILGQWADYFNLIGELCNEHGIKFGFHNHTIEFTAIEAEIGNEPVTRVAYDFLIENTDPEKVFYQLDLYWISRAGKDANDYFERFPGRFLMYHVKDREEIGASGEMDFETPFSNATLAGMKYYIVEVENYNYEPLESVNVSLQYLKSADYILPDYR